MTNLRTYLDPIVVQELSNAIPEIMVRFGRDSLPDGRQRFGIVGNTFRAFHGVQPQPSHVYRTWAEKQTNKIRRHGLADEIRGRSSFLDWHDRLAKSLTRYWARQTGVRLTVAHRYKIVDLYIKWLSHHDLSEPQATKLLVRNANCAIDKYTLAGMNRCFSYALPMKNPSMGDVLDKRTYEFCQDAIGLIAKDAGTSRLVFDEYFWGAGG